MVMNFHPRAAFKVSIIYLQKPEAKRMGVSVAPNTWFSFIGSFTDVQVDPCCAHQFTPTQLRMLAFELCANRENSSSNLLREELVKRFSNINKSGNMTASHFILINFK